jgi:hypothetical protein
MSQPELVARLREARPVAPEELRERVRLVADRSAPPPRRFAWRRAALVLVPALAAAVAAAALLPRGETPEREAVSPPYAQETAPAATEDSRAAGAAGLTQALPKTADAPAPTPGRAQQYSAFLALRVPDAEAVSTATQRALSVVSSLGGHPLSVNLATEGTGGGAQLVLRVPREHVQEAVRRLGALGTIVGANISIQDLQDGVDEASREISRLETRLSTLRAQPPSDELERRIASLRAQLDRLRGERATTVRAAALASVELSIGTPPAVAEDDDGPLSGLGTAFRWAGIGAVYTLALAAPLALLAALAWLAARRMRRRREERLLSAS